VDYGRLLLVAAVLSKRCGLALPSQDIIANAVGGLRVSEPAADLGIALAIASSFRNMGIEPDLTAAGEVGLSGELRPVPQLERRLAEAARLGFKGCLAPTPTPAVAVRDIEIIEVTDLGEALRRGLGSPRKIKADWDEGQAGTA
jgi:DNA repair protein RadA/Sms